MPVTKYVWDELSDNVLMETDELGATTAVYTNKPGEIGGLISQRRGSETSYYHFDGQGSTRELTDSSETVTDTNMYDAWGVEVASSGTTENPFRFIGKLGYYFDKELESYYVRERQYEPTIARWASRDPLSFGATVPQFALAFVAYPYVYVQNNPVNRIDPSGLACREVCEIDKSLEYTRSTCGYFNIPDTPIVRYGFQFRVSAKFKGACECCEYRQYISGKWSYQLFTVEDGIGTPFGPLVVLRHDPEPIEDVITDVVPNRNYGHRTNPPMNIDADKYTPDRLTGCQYNSRDTPGIDVQDLVPRQARRGRFVHAEVDLRFLLTIIDSCIVPNVVKEQVVFDMRCVGNLPIDLPRPPPPRR